MFILGINGSPNQDGNTAFLLREGLSVARELGAKTQLIQVAEILDDLTSPFCEVCTTSCDASCGTGNRLGDALSLLRAADGLIIGSPVYFGTVSGQLKAFWDKTRILRKEKALLNVVGGCVTVGNARFGGQETTLRAIHDLMLVQGMLLVGDGHRDDDCGHQGACAQRPAQEDANGIKRTKILMRRIVEVARATDGLRLRH